MITEDERRRIRREIILGVFEDAKDTFLLKESEYGDAGTKPLADAFFAFFPGGVTISTPEEFTRFWMFMVALGKMNRYAANWPVGHIDSAHDAGNYMHLLEAEHHLERELQVHEEDRG